MTMLSTFEITDKQVAFIKDLIAKKNLSDTARAKLMLGKIAAGEMDKYEASKLIDELIAAKTLPAPASASATLAAHIAGKSVLQNLLADVPKAKYAVPMDEIDLALDEKVNGDIIFVEVREYMNNLYVRRLHGAPGDFNRSRLSMKDTELLINHIKKNPLVYTQKFGEVYSCCGKCGADLTDQVSRELKLGPTCRKEFGM